MRPDASNPSGVVELEHNRIGDAEARDPRVRDLYPVIATLLAWGDKWLAEPEGPPALTVHADCGHVTTAKTVCAECGGELNADTAIAAAGPGARPGPGTAVIGDYITGGVPRS